MCLFFNNDMDWAQAFSPTRYFFRKSFSTQCFSLPDVNVYLQQRTSSHRQRALLLPAIYFHNALGAFDDKRGNRQLNRQGYVAGKVESMWWEWHHCCLISLFFFLLIKHFPRSSEFAEISSYPCLRFYTLHKHGPVCSQRKHVKIWMN